MPLKLSFRPAARVPARALPFGRGTERGFASPVWKRGCSGSSARGGWDVSWMEFGGGSEGKSGLVECGMDKFPLATVLISSKRQWLHPGAAGLARPVCVSGLQRETF